MILGITRVRNESLIIADTIAHFLTYCDGVILYDDCSTDDTAAIAERVGGDRILILHGDEWRANRVAEETRHRSLLLDTAREHGADWVLCFDADERLVGALPELTGVGFTFRLFDGYMTAPFCKPYRDGPLIDLPRMWGPEYRDILMLFRADKAHYHGLDQRAPLLTGYPQSCSVKVKHFGKCLSIQHWEETCDYYAKYFPARYRNKWKARKGKAIHTLSDFNRTLYTWDQLMSGTFGWVKI